MAKYIVIEDFESQYKDPSTGAVQLVIFPKGNVIEARKLSATGRLVTKIDGSLPTFSDGGEKLVFVVESKLKKLEEQGSDENGDSEGDGNGNDDTKKKNLMKWVYLGGAAVLLWWFIYGREDKKKPQ
jgi:hypothetical protein